MPIRKLSSQDLFAHTARKRSAVPAYVEFFATTRVGEGGRAKVAEEGVSRQTLKKRLKTAAGEAGRSIEFRPSAKEEVVFEVTERRRRN
jgi:hypothetical protein